MEKKLLAGGDWRLAAVLLGENPKLHRLQSAGGRSYVFAGWHLGHGTATGEADRRLDVAIFLTVQGRVVTAARHAGYGHPEVEKDHDTPADAVRWLTRMGGGDALCGSCEDAWREACRRWPPLDEGRVVWVP